MSGADKLQKGIRAAQKGDMKRAATMFQALLKSNPKNPDALHLYGVVQHKQGRSKHAIKLIGQSLEIDPLNAMAHNNLGNVYKQIGRDEDAVSSYRKALEIDPINVECLNNTGVSLRNAGHFSESVATLEQALKLSPDMAEAHHNLGCTWGASGQLAKAAECFQKSLSLSGDWIDPVHVAQVFVAWGKPEEAISVLADFVERNPDHVSAKYQLAAVRGETIDAPPEEYVTKVFDGFAGSFDAVLAKLEYRAPELIAEALAAQLGEPAGDRVILDIGCGTGLCGPLIAAYKSRLVGIDLSAEMMRRAELHDVYNSLRQAELQEYMEQQKTDSFDVAICADTLVYLGDLERTFAGIRRILPEGGVFIASVEKQADGSTADYEVGLSGRYRHSRTYIEGLAGKHGLSVSRLDTVILRQESGLDVIGYVFTLTG